MSGIWLLPFFFFSLFPLFLILLFSVALGFQFYSCFPFFSRLCHLRVYLVLSPSFHSCLTVAPSSTFCYWVRFIYGFISLSCGNFASQCSNPLPLILHFNAIYHMLFSVFPTACLLLKCWLYPLFTFSVHFTSCSVLFILSYLLLAVLFVTVFRKARLAAKLQVFCRWVSFPFFSLLFPIK